MSDKSLTGYEAIIPNGGMMGELIRSYDWSPTLGAIESWLPSLKTAVNIMLGSRYPMFIWWGEDKINIYNDAFIPILGALHPEALGQSAPQLWSEAWDILAPKVRGVFQHGQSSWNEAMPFILERNGYSEETYFTFSYSPIFDDADRVGGLLGVNIEDTNRIVSDRRIRTLRELTAQTLNAKTIEDAGKMAVNVLSNNPYDLPFALLYLRDDAETARLIDTTGLEHRTLSPTEIKLDLDNLWSLKSVLQSKTSQIVRLDYSKYGQMPGGVWSKPPKLAIVLPIGTGEQTINGWLIAGVSPYREFNDDYRGFYDLVAGQITAAIANARAYEAEQQRLEALAAIDLAKTAFFSNVSHEFRTPLTLMLSPLEDALFDTQAPLPSQQRLRLELVQRNGLRLLKLVNILLDFSRIEAGRIQALYQPTDLATLTKELASVFRAAIEQASMELVVDCPTLPEAIYVDRELWETIVFNLISNAFKFTWSGKIIVRLRWCRTKVKLTVEDTGVGIARGELPCLFDRFYRVKDSQGRSFEGSGIGLSLVRELVELHAGIIDATSILNKGSCFTISIPTGSAHLPKEHIEENSIDLNVSSLNANPYVQEALSLLQKPSPPDKIQPLVNFLQSSSTITAQILLVDDNADMRDYLKRLLNPYYTVKTVANGVAALDAVRANPPDLVLSDVMMPSMNGFELLRSLRSEPQTKEIPIILLSARAGEKSRIEGLEAGADDYLIKPFSARELLARIEATLKLAELRKTAQNWRSQSEIAEANLQNVLSSLRDGFYILDRAWNFSYVNDRLLEIAELPYEAMINKNIWQLYPEVTNTEFEHNFKRAMEERISLQFEFHYPVWNRWFENRIYPVPDGLAVLVADISDRKEIEREREQLLVRERKARSKAEELNRLKDEFLAIVSHELRTPLNPILGWAQLLRGGKLNPEQVATGVATIERNANLQAQLIDDLLDVSRILRGKIKLNKVSLNLVNVIEPAIATVKLTAEAKSISIIKDFEPDVVVLGDTQRLQQIIGNLLTNAIKFTSEPGKIIVKLNKTNQNACIQVIDTGQGIEPEFLPHVFDRFRQADSASTRNFGGLGLGLTIVRNLTELHGGNVSVNSLGRNRGTTFTIELPLKPAKVEISNDNSPSDNDFAAAKLQGIRILAVDDDADSLSLLAFILEQEGAKVTAVTSAKEAIADLSSSTYKLLVSDIGMPDIDGYKLMRHIRASSSSMATIPAIALSAYAGENDRQQAREAGFQRHISKPLNVNTLISMASELVNKS